MSRAYGLCPCAPTSRTCRKGGSWGETGGFHRGSASDIMLSADLAADELALVADALALVRLGRADAADLGGGLADGLLVDAAHDHLRRRRHFELDSLARRDPDRMRVADLELEVRAGHAGAVADALDLEALLEALRDSLDHVGDERAGQAVERTVGTAIRRARDGDRLALLDDRHARGHLLAELALRSVHGDAPRIDQDGDPGGNFDWLSSDSTQRFTQFLAITRRSRSLRRRFPRARRCGS